MSVQMPGGADGRAGAAGRTFRLGGDGTFAGLREAPKGWFGQAV